VIRENVMRDTYCVLRIPYRVADRAGAGHIIADPVVHAVFYQHLSHDPNHPE
jgi:hypothetical protein